MITENQLENYLRSEDKDYVNKLIESLYEQDDEDIDSSHKVYLSCQFFIKQKQYDIYLYSRKIITFSTFILKFFCY